MLFAVCNEKLQKPKVELNTLTEVAYNVWLANIEVTGDENVYTNEIYVFFSKKNQLPDSIMVDHDNSYGNFDVYFGSLEANTTYSVWAASHGQFMVYSEPQTITTSEPEYFSDTRNGQKYPTIEIGTQVWMAENLNYATQSSVPGGTLPEQGQEYTWAEALNVCPNGWHLPNEAEWRQFENYLSRDGQHRDTLMYYEISPTLGAKLKEQGGEHWEYYSGESTNEFGFTAIQTLSGGAYFWTASEYDEEIAITRKIEQSKNGFFQGTCNKYDKYSVRCVKD